MPTDPKAAPPKPDAAGAAALPSTASGLAATYGPVLGGVGVTAAILEFMRDDPHELIRLLGEFGPKYLLGGFICYVVWDIARRVLKLFARGVDHIGTLAENTGAAAKATAEGANAIKDFAGRNDRTAEEVRRLSAFAAQQADRSVEIAIENGKKMDLLLQQQRGQTP